MLIMPSSSVCILAKFLKAFDGLTVSLISLTTLTTIMSLKKKFYFFKKDVKLTVGKLEGCFLY